MVGVGLEGVWRGSGETDKARSEKAGEGVKERDRSRVAQREPLSSFRWICMAMVEGGMGSVSASRADRIMGDNNIALNTSNPL